MTVEDDERAAFLQLAPTSPVERRRSTPSTRIYAISRAAADAIVLPPDERKLAAMSVAAMLMATSATGHIDVYTAQRRKVKRNAEKASAAQVCRHASMGMQAALRSYRYAVKWGLPHDRRFPYEVSRSYRGTKRSRDTITHAKWGRVKHDATFTQVCCVCSKPSTAPFTETSDGKVFDW